MSSSSLTQNSPLLFYLERTVPQGATITGIAYGVVLTLYLMNMTLLVTVFRRTRRTFGSQTRTVFFLVYITALFILATLFMVSCAQMTIDLDLNLAEFPEHSPRLIKTFDTMGNITFIVSNWLADGLLVWRCWVVYRDGQIPMYIVMSLPFLLCLGSLATGTTFIVLFLSMEPNALSFPAAIFPMMLVYLFISLVLNLIVSSMIAGRIICYRCRVRATLSRVHSRQYTTIAAMIVESAALYAICSLIFLVPFALGLGNNVFLQLLAQVQVIAPYLIIFRVMKGKAWPSSGTAQLFSSYTSSPQAISDGIDLGERNTTMMLRFGPPPPAALRNTHDIFLPSSKRLSTIPEVTSGGKMEEP